MQTVYFKILDFDPNTGLQFGSEGLHDGWSGRRTLHVLSTAAGSLNISVVDPDPDSGSK